MFSFRGIVDRDDIGYVEKRYGRALYGEPCPIKDGKINPHVSRFLLADGQTASIFHVKPFYYLHQNGEWRPLSEVTTYHGNRRIDLAENWDKLMDLRYVRWLMKRCKLIGGSVNIPWKTVQIGLKEMETVFFTTSTFYPDPDPETTTVDGWVENDMTSDSWTNVRGVAVGTSKTDDVAGGANANGLGIALESSAVANKWRMMRRAFVLFDTSSIPDTDSISAATFSWFGAATSSDSAGWTASQKQLRIVSSTPASNTVLATADYNDVGSTSFASLDQASFSTSGYNDFALDTNGIANISKTGISKFGMRTGADADNSEPTWELGKIVYFRGYWAEQAGTTNDPKLVVIHAAPTASGNMFNFF